MEKEIKKIRNDIEGREEESKYKYIIFVLIIFVIILFVTTIFYAINYNVAKNQAFDLCMLNNDGIDLVNTLKNNWNNYCAIDEESMLDAEDIERMDCRFYR